MPKRCALQPTDIITFNFYSLPFTCWVPRLQKFILACPVEIAFTECGFNVFWRSIVCFTIASTKLNRVIVVLTSSSSALLSRISDCNNINGDDKLERRCNADMSTGDYKPKNFYGGICVNLVVWQVGKGMTPEITSKSQVNALDCGAREAKLMIFLPKSRWIAVIKVKPHHSPVISSTRSRVSFTIDYLRLTDNTSH